MVYSSVNKVDGQALVLGKPVFTDDLDRFPDTLTVKLLRSPHAHALIRKIDTGRAKHMEGVVGVYTYEDVPQLRYTISGESYPELSPYDRLLLDRRVRYVGDPVAIVAAENEKAARLALKAIQVEYEILPALLDPLAAEDNEIIVHPEDKNFMPDDFLGLDQEHNIVGRYSVEKGNLPEALRESELVIERCYHTQPQAHCMMETYRAFCYLDEAQRLVFTSSTQSVHHARRQISKSLGVPLGKIRVVKPKIGGGFGGKNIALIEPYVGFVSLMTGRPSKLVFTRKETFTSSNSRHEFFFRIRLGATKSGVLKAVDIEALNNTGAYGEDGPAVLLVSAGNMLPLYNKAEAISYQGKTAYTNLLPAGAMRGYGATQSTFAMESAVNELASRLGMDPTEFRLKNLVTVGDTGGILGLTIQSCSLAECIRRGKELIGWNEKYPRREIAPGRIRSVGMAVACHGSGVSGVGMASVTLTLEEDGSYLLLTGSADLGTGSDTILTQIAAEAMKTTLDHVTVRSGSTDYPYDTGAFASCTTYVTGNAVVDAAETLTCKLLKAAGKKLEKDPGELALGSDRVFAADHPEDYVLLKTLGIESTFGAHEILSATETHRCSVSPPPFGAGFAEVELDTETGKVELIQFVAVMDCGKPINPKLARVQAEGGLAQGIGLALYEEVHRASNGRLVTDSFLQYKIPTRKDIRKVTVEFAESFEPTGPFGAKSIGEIVVHTPAPAIAGAVYNAVGVSIRDLPITPEKLLRAMAEH